MARKRYKLTDAHFARFKVYVDKWKSLLGLGDWEADVVFENPKGVMAQTLCNCQGRIATVKAAKTWRVEPTEYNIEWIAAHEVCHILIADFAEAAHDRYVGEQKLLDLEEKAVVRLENFIKHHYLLEPPSPSKQE